MFIKKLVKNASDHHFGVTNPSLMPSQSRAHATSGRLVSRCRLRKHGAGGPPTSPRSRRAARRFRRSSSGSTARRAKPGLFVGGAFSPVGSDLFSFVRFINGDLRWSTFQDLPDAHFRLYREARSEQNYYGKRMETNPNNNDVFCFCFQERFKT